MIRASYRSSNTIWPLDLCLFPFFFQAESSMLDLISTYQQCQDLKVDTSLDDLEIKDLEEFEDSLESWDCLDGHVNGHVNSLLA